MVRTYEGKLRLATMVGLLGAVAVGLIAGRVARLGAPGENFWLTFPLLLVVGALALLGLLPWWRRVDDVQKSVHLASWYWGGMAGGIVALMGAVAAVGPRGELAKGAGLVLVAQAVCFLLVLAIYRLRLRQPSA